MSSRMDPSSGPFVMLLCSTIPTFSLYHLPGATFPSSPNELVKDTSDGFSLPDPNDWSLIRSAGSKSSASLFQTISPVSSSNKN